MNISTVNELIQSLESAGELSIKETKVMALAKAFKQLAAENAALKQAESNLVRNIINDLGDTELQYAKVHTPATDRIVAGIKADGVDEFAAHLRANDNGASVCKMIALGADDFAKQLREGAK
ncbi:hypothetical protein P4R16_001033 [Klebsiella oxytoca]|uniref:hypothetical protein n=1 Tax=Klebsiella oxytoca TaxID=571 RepID=UPI00066A94A2|nr:hypothetical protein [Klebsiella oxytoca]EKT7900142.1 hypothetical protein [Klebsiella oxytoca]KMV90561.1 hypothetical protein HMPREF9688_03360 [Klebsiella oxytoca 10-5244]TXU75968.1 hypothetical protein D4N05_09175 [Klebsiella oxytoca]